MAILSLTIFFIGTILLYTYFSCPLNNFFITINMIVSIVQMLVSILPRIIRSQKGGILPAAMLAAYNTYLIATAVDINPSLCGIAANLGGSSGGGSANTSAATVIQIVGVAFVVVSVGYSAFSAGVSDVLGYDATQAAAYGEINDEEEQIAYHYSFFHAAFFLAAFYMASVFTNWDKFSIEPLLAVNTTLPIPPSSNSTLSPISSQIVEIGKGDHAMWVAVATSWLGSLIYIWTLVAPILFPNRDFS
eukprot:jgi/Hompol1/5750/HPOL_002071-RA